ncbi:MAG: glycosyltransferase family 4 protein [Pseudomarimonas sp.]
MVALVRGSKAHDPDRYRAAHPELDTVEIDGRGLASEGRVLAVMRCVRRVRPALFVPLVVADAHEAAAWLRWQGCPSRYLLALHGNTTTQLVDARHKLAFADYAIAPGVLTARLLNELGMPLDRLKHVPNGARDAVRPWQQRPAGEPLRLGYVGRLTRGDKRVGDMVPLLKSLCARGVAFDMVVAGDGPERLRLEADLQGLPVRFLGALTAEQLYQDVYPMLDALLLFSESEAFGITLVEAMLHGVVPVSSAFVGQAAEGIVQHGQTGLVFPIGDAETAANCVACLAHQPVVFARLAQAAQQRVVGRYGWQRCVSGWQDGMEAALAMPAREMPQRSPAITGKSDPSRMRARSLDRIRRLRRLLRGVPPAMVGGEEWPWAPRPRNPQDLSDMQALRLSLDVSNDLSDRESCHSTCAQQP